VEPPSKSKVEEESKEQPKAKPKAKID